MHSLDNARVDSKYTGLLETIYETSVIVVKLDEDLKTEQIKVKKGVRQGDTISPKLFILALKDVFKGLNWEGKGISIDGEFLHHLRFADDVVLISEDPLELSTMIEQLHHASQKIGLEVNIKKTKILSTQNIQLSIGGKKIENVDEYCICIPRA